MDFALKVLLSAVGLCATALPALWLHALVTGSRQTERFMTSGGERLRPLGWGALAGATVMTWKSTSALLWFIPASWGTTDENGHFSPLRDSIGILAGCLSGLGLASFAFTLQSITSTRDWMKKARETAHLLPGAYATSAVAHQRAAEAWRAAHAAHLAARNAAVHYSNRAKAETLALYAKHAAEAAEDAATAAISVIRASQEVRGRALTEADNAAKEAFRAATAIPEEPINTDAILAARRANEAGETARRS